MTEIHPVNRRIAALSFFILVFFSVTNWGCSHAEKAGPQFKNVIMMVPDGSGQDVVTLAQWWKGEPLALDRDLRGAVRTYMVDSVITDSAAAATAFATGSKTCSRFIAVGAACNKLTPGKELFPTSLQYKPLATILEAAKLAGKATGLVATSSVTHATPAAFAAHVHDRGMDNEIMEHLVYQNIDLVFGGGKRYLIPEAAGGNRNDGEDLLRVLLGRGYKFVENKKDMQAVSRAQVWGIFADNHMEADVDRDEFAAYQPSLAEMTAKAIELLSKSEKGFFLLIEGSQVDWAGHDHDAYHRVTDFLAFDDAYRVARQFAQKDGRTLLLAFPDHNTGGMTIGRENAALDYTATSIEYLLEPLQKMHTTRTGVTATGLDRMIEAEMAGGLTETDSIRKNLHEWWGMAVKDSDVAGIINLRKSGMSRKRAIGEVTSGQYTAFGWTTFEHTGENVPLWAYGQSGAYGVIDNTGLAFIAADALGLDLEQADKELYVDVKTVFPEAGLEMSDAANPVLRIAAAALPVSKDVLRISGKQIQLPGLVVYAPLAPAGTPLPDAAATGRVYIPSQAVRRIMQESGIE